MSERTRGLELIRVPSAVFAAFHTAIGATSGATDGAYVLRRAGLQSGDAFHELFRDWLSEAGRGAGEPEDLDAATFWNRLGDFFTQLGWGTLEFEQLHDGVIAVTLRDWFEALGAAEASGGCHFTTGLLAQLLRRVAGQDVAALEVEFDPADSGRCRILFGGPAALGSVHERIAEGVPYGAAVAALG